jgi:DHA2 family metal-tetracycline-proton antiporter-like MFS transporter
MYVGFNFTQTALINSVSQTLSEHETGIGMGLFNLVSFVSAAVGTSLVGRYLEGHWLNFFHNPLVMDSRAFPYSNLLIVFALFILVGAAVYYRSQRAAMNTSEGTP